MLLQTDTTPISHQPVAVIRQPADFMTTDPLGNLYLLQKDQVTKYNSKGDSLSSQSFNWLGTISTMDAGNGLRLLLFYRDLNQLVVLDNTLSMQGEPVKLEKLGLQFTRLVCQSANNNDLWVYDTDEFRLLRLNKNFGIIRNSGNITQITGHDLDPDYMTEYGNMLYLNDSRYGILVFDMFGTYYKTIPVKSLNYFQLVDNFIYFLQDNKLFRYNMRSFETASIPLPMKGIRSFRLEKKQLYLLGEKSVEIYTLP